MNEEWRAVVGYPYEVSSRGKVRRTLAKRGARVGRILVNTIGENGYPCVGIATMDGVSKNVCVHNLVCEAFHGPKPSQRHEVAHWDGVRTNCEQGNLRWATRKENMEDACRHDTVQKGTDHYNAKLDEPTVLRIRKLASSGISHGNLSIQFNVARQTIGKIVNRKIWAHVQ